RGRGQPRREGAAAAAGAGDGVPDPVAGAVRPGDGGVDGLWHAGGGDAVRGRAGGDRAGTQRRDRGRVRGPGGRGGAGAVAGSGRVPGKRSGAVLAAADDRGLRGGVPPTSGRLDVELRATVRRLLFIFLCLLGVGVLLLLVLRSGRGPAPEMDEPEREPYWEPE